MDINIRQSGVLTVRTIDASINKLSKEIENKLNFRDRVMKRYRWKNARYQRINYKSR